MGDGELVISVDSQGNWSSTTPEDRLQLFNESLNWFDAEDFCVSRGGHLASVVSDIH